MANYSNEYDVAVIGAGASGMMAAGRAGELGAKTLLIERNDIPGKKLLITGKGRCNITNSMEIDGFIENYGRNGKFLYRAFREFFNQDLIEFFRSLGVETKVERGGRVFPQSDKAQDAVDALEKYVKQNNVSLMFKTRVSDVFIKESRVVGLKLHDNTSIKTKNVIIATGGLSYPATGSSGDGYEIAKRLGHEIVDLKPSLVPLEILEDLVKEIQGLSLKNAGVSILANGKIIDSDFGEMLFTHFGISGPVVLSMSAKAVTALEKNEKVEVSINLKPKLDRETLDKRLLREFEENSLKSIKNLLKNLLPQSMIPVFIRLLKIPEEKKCSQINAKERESLLKLLMDFRLTVKRPRPLSEAIVTKGGVSLGQINPHTMESKIIKGLYFCGEVVDVEGLTGGYNLQAAFSMGHLAGTNAAQHLDD